MHTIAANAGVEGAVVVGKLLEQDNTDLGYDAAKGQLLENFLLISLQRLSPSVHSDLLNEIFFIQVSMLIWSSLELSIH